MIGKILDYIKDENDIQIKFEYGAADIIIINPYIVNIFSNQSNKRKKSRAIENLQIEKCSINVYKNKDYVAIKTIFLSIKVFDDFKVDFYNNKGVLICSDYRGKRETIFRDGKLANVMGKGLKLDNADKSHNIEVIKTLLGGECFYGLGEKTGNLNKSCSFFEMWNSDVPAPHVESMKSLYKSIPFFITLRNNEAFGIFFDNTYKTYFDMGKESNKYYYFAADDGELNYYFIYGPKVSKVINGYTYLTGRTPLPQTWVLGYQQSRWGYTTCDRVIGIAKSFRNKKIPCDVIYLDIDYMDNYKVYTWNKVKFKEHDKMIKALFNIGFKVVVIVDPGIKKEIGYFMYDEGRNNNYFVRNRDGSTCINKVWPGDSAFPDFTDIRVRKWWSDKQKIMVDSKISGIWNDMNEPASFEGPLPDDAVFNNDDCITDHKEVHNVYGHLMSMAAYKGLKNYTRKRPFVLTRACYSGTQKYSAVWTGDNCSSWEHLRMSIPMLLNLGMSGMTLCGADVGGFQFDCTGELLIRWFQVGCFYPLFRNHSGLYTKYQEPWEFGSDIETIIRKYIELRYKLIPYLYELMKESEESGMPVMRALFMNYQEDSNTYEINDEFLVGNDILVAPIVSQGQTARQVYLPGDSWIDFWSDIEYKGGTYILADAQLDKCPIYIKKGSMIPSWPVQQFIGESKIKDVIIQVYPGNGNSIIYEDNGTDFKYLDGEYNKYELCMKNNDNYINILVNTLQKKYASGAADFEFIIHNSDIQSVLVDSQPVEFKKENGVIKFCTPAISENIIINI